MKSAQPTSPDNLIEKLRTLPLLILLDYDGTLTDFKSNPELSNISPSTRALLYRLQRLHPVIMVTGRNADSLEKVSGLRGIPIVGTHGFEARNLPGKIQFAAETARRLFKEEAERLWRKASGLKRRYPGIHLEKKPYSSTLHFRGGRLTTGQIRKLVREFKTLFNQTVTRGRWTLQDGKKMIEAMPKGFSKGKSVRKILKKFPGRFPLYAGDDLGDISAFKGLGKKGLRIAVGKRIPGKFIDRRFGKPRDFIEWLRKLERSFA